MTETNEKAVSRGDYSEGISIETSKVVQGMSLVFSGAMTMLEAIHPKISLQPAELMCLMTGDREGLARLAEMKKEEAAKAAQDELEAKAKEETDETENADAGAVDVPADAPDAAVPDAPAGNGKADSVTQENTEPQETKEPKEATKPSKSATTTVSQDDITKIIVQKIKADRSNNGKIGQLLKNYGAARVSELPVEKYEAFITELAAI